MHLGRGSHCVDTVDEGTRRRSSDAWRKIGHSSSHWPLMRRRIRCLAMKFKHRNCFLWFSALTCSFGGLLLLVGRNYTASVPVLETYDFVNGDPVRVEFKPRWSDKCHPVTKLAFLKVHKAGSSTVANIIQRFGFTRNLNFVVPRKPLHTFAYNYIGHRGDTVSRDRILPPPPGESYDILWNHVTYNHDAFREIMPKDTRYISILREPFDQFVSAYEYYVLVGKRRNETLHQHRNPIADYLDNEGQRSVRSRMDRVRNSQSYDMGFTFPALSNRTEAMAYISHLDGDFDLVMLMEYFDESLVLLKRIFCWSLKDILYFHHNKNNRRQQWMFSRDHYGKHRNISRADYDLYNHFRKVFWKKVWSQGSDFFEEVRYFKQLLHQLRDYCIVGRTLEVPQSVWGDGFVVDQRDCFYIKMSELAFFDRILNTTYTKISSNANSFHKPH
ncbi:galactosylceramide sulfotransferase-like [Haliotis rufescens]|uniref:galactosylceramide sulfotransferase-like n=1 Tax=Haliotis rufescens TaxID=6454 RepID=UPI00201F8C98|nr:galactosylceramide sulfotransferase-like [Haliotis rufescens]